MSLLARAIRERQRAPGLGEPLLVRWILVALALAVIGILLVLPLALVLATALADGWRAYKTALADPIAQSAIRLTLLAALIAVPVNMVFGIAAAWLLTRFQFRGRHFLLTLIDVPFSVSPVVVGLSLVLLLGPDGLGPWLADHGIRLLFAKPAIVLATLFVTLPFVARELIPVLESKGAEEERAALTLGASGWRTFWSITLPSMRWGLLYGCILCNARAMGEFGAVSVVSGHIRGRTNTLPLHVEVLYNEYEFQSAFAAASLLAFLAIVTLVAKSIVEWKTQQEGRG